MFCCFFKKKVFLLCKSSKTEKNVYIWNRPQNKVNMSFIPHGECLKKTIELLMLFILPPKNKISNTSLKQKKYYYAIPLCTNF